jgi:hypothetical protein
VRVGPHGPAAASGSQPKSDAPKPDRFKRVPVAEAWCVVIDEDELVNCTRLNAAGRPARADTVSIELGAIADDGRHWDLWQSRTISRNSSRSGSSNALPRSSGIASVRRRRLSSGTKRPASNGFRLIRQVTAGHHRLGSTAVADAPAQWFGAPAQPVGRPAAARGARLVRGRRETPNRPPAILSAPEHPRRRHHLPAVEPLQPHCWTESPLPGPPTPRL